jgi:ribosomal protein L29
MSTPVSTAELKRLSPTELRKEIYLRRVECAKMRIGIKMQSEKNHALYRTKRREIGRLMTILQGQERSEKNTTNEKAKKIDASQVSGNTVKDPGLKAAKANSVPTKSRKSSLPSLSSEASAKEDSSPL